LLSVAGIIHPQMVSNPKPCMQRPQ
jgi:hypothetical protein